MPTITPFLFVLALASPQEPTPAPAVTSVDVSPAVRATNELGIALYKALDREQPGKNLFLSPLSITIAMAMLAEGARDETAAEFAQAFHLALNTPLADLHADLNRLVERYRNGGGSADPALRERIADLRERFAAAEAAAKTRRDDDGAGWVEDLRRGNELAVQLNQLLCEVDRYELRAANGLWVERTNPLVPAFVQALDRWYGTGGVNSLDILGNTEAARRRINGWVEEHTERHIKDLIPTGGINASTRLVISNAVYFRGEWTDPFDARRTRDEDFLLADGARTRVKLMRDAKRKDVPYAAFTGDGRAFATPDVVPAEGDGRAFAKLGAAPAEAAKPPATYPGDDGFTMVELPYKGGELAMLVLAPRAPDGLPRIERLLDATSLASWTAQLRPRTVDTAMPRFEQRNSFELSRALQAAGVRRAFTGDAQFGGIAADHALFVDNVHHQAWLQVDEKGTVAVAATAVAMSVGASRRVPFIPVFRADRPFLFLIRDVKSGAILFLGRVFDPRT
jgi:serine protease inhibitor